MAGASIQFKKMLLGHDRMSRDQILYKLSNWLMQQHLNDPQAGLCSSIFQMLCNDNGYQTDSQFENNMNWMTLRGYDQCKSLQQIVDARLSIPSIPPPSQEVISSEEKKESIEKEKKKPRRSIPKKVRSMVWTNHFGESMSGNCFCCKKLLHALDEWHAGHIVSHANGGKDTAANLRPVCISCNLSMGTENMDEFKARCYSL